MIFTFCDPLAARESETNARSSKQNRNPRSQYFISHALLSFLLCLTAITRRQSARGFCQSLSASDCLTYQVSHCRTAYVNQESRATELSFPPNDLSNTSLQICHKF